MRTSALVRDALRTTLGLLALVAPATGLAENAAGTVRDAARGSALPGATLVIAAVEDEREGTRSLSFHEAQKRSTTSDAAGRFSLTLPAGADALLVRVALPGFAPVVARVVPGPDNTIELGPGAFVRGSLRSAPAGAAADLPRQVKLVERSEPAPSPGPFVAAVRPDGSFEFEDVPVGRTYWIFNPLAKSNGRLVLNARSVSVEGSVVDLGVLALEGGRPLSGCLVFPDGVRRSGAERGWVVRQSGLDARELTLDEVGCFATDGLPAEEIQVRFHLPGWLVARSTMGFDVREWPPTAVRFPRGEDLTGLRIDLVRDETSGE